MSRDGRFFSCRKARFYWLGKTSSTGRWSGFQSVQISWFRRGKPVSIFFNFKLFKNKLICGFIVLYLLKTCTFQCIFDDKQVHVRFLQDSWSDLSEDSDSEIALARRRAKSKVDQHQLNSGSPSRYAVEVHCYARNYLNFQSIFLSLRTHIFIGSIFPSLKSMWHITSNRWLWLLMMHNLKTNRGFGWRITLWFSIGNIKGIHVQQANIDGVQLIISGRYPIKQ